MISAMHSESGSAVTAPLTNVRPKPAAYPRAQATRHPPNTQRWCKAPVPHGYENWLANADANIGSDHNAQDLVAHIRQLGEMGHWIWPKRPVHFVSDLHADARSLLESLNLAGLVKITGKKLCQFELSDAGRDARIIIGGDCLDKGPSNLKLLDTIQALRSAGADIVLLAGNHDLRLPLGLRTFENPTNTPVDVRYEHLFVRMGRKTLPLLVEIWKRRLSKKKKPLAGIPDKATCLAQLLPAEDWPERFRRAMTGRMPVEALDREIRRIVEKKAVFEQDRQSLGLGIRKIYAAAREAYRMFLEPGGDYAWFIPSLKLVTREGSFLFAHAGLEDQTAQWLARTGVDDINRAFDEAFAADPFGFYAGPLGNTLRTKYRPVDYPLSDTGTAALKSAGIFAVVHGHRSHRQGQRLSLRANLLHIEGDVTLDRNSRRLEGLESRGAGIVSIFPDGIILGVSSDYPTTKVFAPEAYLESDQNPTDASQ